MKEKTYSRELFKELKKWTNRKEILAVKGPRQAGKTTLMKMLINWLIKEKAIQQERIKFLTFEDLEIQEKFNENPKEFIESFIQGKGKHYFVFDEFHYAIDGGRKLKLLFDTVENVKFLVTGSSSLEITAFSRNLVGRVFSFNLMPFSFREFMQKNKLAEKYNEMNSKVMKFIFNGKNFEISNDIFLKDVMKTFGKYVVYGGYPEVVKANNIETKMIVLKNIYETYIGKDIITLLKIHDIFKFRKLVTALASSTGGITNYNNLAELLSGYYKEITGLLNILEETFIIRIVRPYHKNLRTELRKNPKIYFIDTGLRNYAVNDFSDINNRADRGVLIENVVHNSLAVMSKDFNKIKYWRTLGKAEVDFVAETMKGIVPIEVKFISMKKPKISKSFRSFISTYKPERGLIVTKDFWGETTIGKTKIKFVPACYL